MKPDELKDVHAHLESKYPEEGCGLIFRRKDGSHRGQPMANVYDRYAARDPKTYPRTAKTAYLMNPMEVARAIEAAELAGETLVSIFHSHCDVGAYFSSEDKAMAAPEGQPLHPGVSYLVVAVDQRHVTTQKLFAWNGTEFLEVSMG